MALGRPVVTTQTGIEGIPVENIESVKVSDDPYTFANHVVDLLNLKKDTTQMGSDSRELIIENFDTFRLSTRLSQFFKTQV